MRTVELIFTSEDLINLKLSMPAPPAHLPPNHCDLMVERALAYLSTWAMDSENYAHCVITLNVKEREFTACYYRDGSTGPCGERERPSYVIGAVWHGDHFGFHS